MSVEWKTQMKSNITWRKNDKQQQHIKHIAITIHYNFFQYYTNGFLEFIQPIKRENTWMSVCECFCFL